MFSHNASLGKGERSGWALHCDNETSGPRDSEAGLKTQVSDRIPGEISRCAGGFSLAGLQADYIIFALGVAAVDFCHFDFVTFGPLCDFQVRCFECSKIESNR